LQEFGYKAWKTVCPSVTIAVLNHDILPVNVSEVLQPLAECIGERIGIVGGRGNSSLQKSDSRDFS
jgi:hypothetical protein